MFTNKYLVSTIGAVAFVVGGLMARNTAIETTEMLEKTFGKKKQSDTTPAE